jgi:aryl-alcohol dehydrogenase-like predicted oxidoreductase
LFPWSSQARGFFSDNDHDTLDPNTWRCWNSESNFQRRTRCDTLATKLGCRPVNIALAYVLAQPFPVFPIIGPQTVAELIIALDGLRIELDSGLLHWLESGGNGEVS